MIDPTQYPYGLEANPDYEYSEVESCCSQCMEKGLQWGHPFCWVETIPEDWEAASEPILYGNGRWSRLIRRPRPVNPERHHA